VLLEGCQSDSSLSHSDAESLSSKRALAATVPCQHASLSVIGKDVMPTFFQATRRNVP